MPVTSKSINDYFNSKQDNFLLLRIFTASAVVYGHSFALSVVKGDKGLFF